MIVFRSIRACRVLGTSTATTSKTFDSDGNVITATDALGKVTTVAYDARGRKTTTTDRINAVTAFTYDAVSNLKKIVDADSANGITQYYYDDRNLLTREEFPTHVAGTNPGQVGNDAKTYVYDAGRRLTSRTDQAGVVTSYAYDNANRLITRGYPDSLNDTFSYDPASRLVSAASARYTNTVARSYDAAGRLISEGLTTNGQIYSTLSGYDNANRRTTITYPNGQVISRAYSDRNQLSDIWYGAQIPSNRALTRTYTDAGRLLTSNFGNNLTETRTYLTDGLTNAMVTPGVTNFTYGYDANKRKTQETNGIIPNNSQTFNYDSQDRLTNWTRLSGDAQNWSLSLVGDWNSTTGSKNGSAFSETRTHNAVHELTAINSSPLGYDFKGNLTQDQTSKLYTWDQENRLKQAVIPAGLTDGSTAGTHTYQYDALGRRVAKVVAGAVTVFAHDGAQVICEYTGTLAPTSPARVQVWGDYIDELILHVNSGQKYYAHVNHLYSVEALTDSAGVVVERYRYDAYGAQKVYSGAGVARAVSLFNQKSGFTGRYFDEENGIFYFRSRPYSPSQGRFIQRDKWFRRLGRPTQGDGYPEAPFNFYAYCSGNVGSSLDPMGMRTFVVNYSLWGVEKTNWLATVITLNNADTGNGNVVFDLRVGYNYIKALGTRNNSNNTEATVVVSRWTSNPGPVLLAAWYSTGVISHAASGTAYPICCEKDKNGKPSKWGLEVQAQFVSTAGKLSVKEGASLEYENHGIKGGTSWETSRENDGFTVQPSAKYKLCPTGGTDYTVELLSTNGVGIAATENVWHQFHQSDGRTWFQSRLSHEKKN